MSKDTYKLTYFNIRARAEPIRFIFAVADVPYVDYRLDREDWPNQKKNFPWGKLPILEINGERLAESTAICRYLAKKFNLTGANELEAAKCDEYVDAMMDCRSHWLAYFRETDTTKKEELKSALLNVHIPFYFAMFESILESSNGKFLLGSNYTWADLHIAHTLSFIDELVKPGLLKEYPRLTRFSEDVFNIPRIKTWIEKRPITER